MVNPVLVHFGFVTISLILFAYGIRGQAQKRAKSVTTVLEAKWPATPLVLEAVEYLAEEHTDFYWGFIDRIAALEPPLVQIDTDKGRYDKVIEVASEFLPESNVPILKWALSMHIFSPKIQMFAQIATERGLPKDCGAVVDVGGELTCNIKRIRELIQQKKSSSNPTTVDIFNVDRHFPGTENLTLHVILYGELGTDEFTRFYRELRILAEKGQINYIIRPYVQINSEKRLRLSGYGVELQMKSTEYKAQDDSQLKAQMEQSSDPNQKLQQQEQQQDLNSEIAGFNFNILKSRYPDLHMELDTVRDHLEETSNVLTPLKVWEFQELSLKAAQKIMTVPNDQALKTLTLIAQNFPVQAKGLLKIPVSNELRHEISSNQNDLLMNLNLQTTDTALFINGLYYDMDLVDVYGLFDVVRHEIRTLNGLRTIGLNDETVRKLIALDVDLSGGGDSGQNREFAIDIRDSAVTWINDLEQDAVYERKCSPHLKQLLQVSFFGGMQQIRRNLYNLIFVIDPTQADQRALLQEEFFRGDCNWRVGVVFVVSPAPNVRGHDDVGVALQSIFNYLCQTKSNRYAIDFIRTVPTTTDQLTVDQVRAHFARDVDQDTMNDVLDEDSSYDFGRMLSRDLYERLDQDKLPVVLLNGAPLGQSVLREPVNKLVYNVQQEILQEMMFFQREYYQGKLRNDDNVVDFLMSQPNVMPRLNDRILNRHRSDKIVHLDMIGRSAPNLMDLEQLQELSTRDMTATAVTNLPYCHSVRGGAKTYHHMTYWIIGDLRDAPTKRLLSAALNYCKKESSARVTFLPNVRDSQDNFANQLVLSALNHYKPDVALNTVSKWLENEEFPPKQQGDISDEVWAGAANEELNLKLLRVYCQKVLHLSGGQRAVVANSRVLGPFRDTELFTIDDFDLLQRFSSVTHLNKIINTMKTPSTDKNPVQLTSDVIMQTVSVMSTKQTSKSRFDVHFKSDQYSVLTIPPKSTKEIALDVVAILDPVSRGAQKLSTILQVLQNVVNVKIRIFLNSAEKNSDMPLKSFYRYVLEPEIQFSAVDGQQMAGPLARFSNMPHAPLLTQNLHVPENWMVNVVRAFYDLDNIRLEHVERNVHSEYELEYLLVEGHCFETSLGGAPRGLQMTLGTDTSPVKYDTIVMANLGYFQMKANAGAWILRLRQGRSADIYTIVHHSGTDTPENSTDIKILVSSFRAHIVKLRVQKKPDKIHMDLQSDDNANTGIWNSITSSFSGTSSTPSSDPNSTTDDTLNIFSLASGHLYERFLRIMMLSILKHTKRPVKFWFLKNYLSPQVKDFLPYMARKYDFAYELVQYKWPRWLHQQSEKQRIIWGYKILFLDVLFPLDVRKIIFVDADQVVRTDLYELHEFDLGGAPYGYTPFCESRQEMDGFRFWKQGYWRTHLQGRRYHISALYVVDLKRFRQIAAGDRLRGQYQALSQDPNSLSNLDQDLPNNMIHQVAIKSLPQEWLWCETWCDDESLGTAKTIDLCNNPMTKEAKLDAAMRILPEWKDYDQEIQELQKRISTSGDMDENRDTDDRRQDQTTHAHQHTEL